jgi:hypothetical protein
MSVNALYCFQVPNSESKENEQYILVGFSSAVQKIISWKINFSTDSCYANLVGLDDIATLEAAFTSLTSYAGPQISLYSDMPLERRFLFASYKRSELFLWNLNVPISEMGNGQELSSIWNAHGPITCDLGDIVSVCGMNNNSIAIGL